MGKVWDIGKFFLYPRPSLFDIVVCLGVIPIGHIDRLYQGIYLVLYSLVLLSLSMGIECKRKFKSVGASLILGWSLLSVYFHSVGLNTQSLMFKYINFSLMAESFIYVLAAFLIVRTVVTKATNIRPLLITIPIALAPLVSKMIYFGQMTPLFSVLLAFVFLLGWKKKYAVQVFVVVVGLIIFILNYNWIAMKFNCRPYVMIELSRQIMDNTLVGTGFNRFLTPDNLVWVREIGGLEYGWLYRHNDFLSITAFSGLPILVGIGVFMRELWVAVRGSIYTVAYLTIALTCFFQITMFLPDRALIVLLTICLMYCEAHNGKV